MQHVDDHCMLNLDISVHSLRIRATVQHPNILTPQFHDVVPHHHPASYVEDIIIFMLLSFEFRYSKIFLIFSMKFLVFSRAILHCQEPDGHQVKIAMHKQYFFKRAEILISLLICLITRRLALQYVF